MYFQRPRGRARGRWRRAPSRSGSGSRAAAEQAEEVFFCAAAAWRNRCSRRSLAAGFLDDDGRRRLGVVAAWRAAGCARPACRPGWRRASGGGSGGRRAAASGRRGGGGLGRGPVGRGGGGGRVRISSRALRKALAALPGLFVERRVGIDVCACSVPPRCRDAEQRTPGRQPTRRRRGRRTRGGETTWEDRLDSARRRGRRAGDCPRARRADGARRCAQGRVGHLRTSTALSRPPSSRSRHVTHVQVSSTIRPARRRRFRCSANRVP